VKHTGATGLRHLLPYLRQHRARLGIVFLLVVVASFIDQAQPYLIRDAIDKHILTARPDLGVVAWMSLGYLALVLLSFVLTYYLELLLQRTGQSIVREIRADLLRHIQGLSLRYFDTNSSGRIITNVVSDTEALNNFFTDFLSNTLRGCISLTLIIFFMLRMDVRFTCYSLLMVPVIGTVSYFIRFFLRKVNQEMRHRLSAAIAFLAETLSGMAVIQVFDREKKQQEDFDVCNRALLESTIKETHLNFAYFLVAETLGDLGVAALIWFGGGAVIRGSVTFGVLFAFITYIRRFFQPINQITQQLNVLQSAVIASDRITATLRETPDICEEGAGQPFVASGRIVFEGVHFAYRPGQPVLHGIDLVIEPGQRVGFVGPSGAGKTSLINLLARFYDVTDGVIRLDGRDVRSIPLKVLRETIGIVQQDVTLFSGSLIDNIRFFRTEIPEARVVEACTLVGADEFIRRLPQGYQTPLSERGSTLSFGERQLLSFARAMTFNPKILILDEATASLDSVSEAILQRAIGRVANGRTLLVIAHRLSTVRQMDFIVVLDHGRIAERGPHEKLLAQGGIYHRLHRASALPVALAP